ncbi:MAG TPA: cyclic nucleotide-binding domain-containing protein [Xanthobacteraceae bacterium]|nr:cyclic nucleotide-binding domain-containing protein [Xanthobacteraceae bacterium]
MSLEDDIAQLSRVPTLRLLGSDALRMLAIASEQRNLAAGEVLFRAGDAADAGYVVQRGALNISVDDGSGQSVVAGPDALLGELALVMVIQRPGTATALENTSVLRISRTLFQRVLESDPLAARRLRDEFMIRTSQVISDLTVISGRLL